jgi:hypothetical protein
MRRAAFAVTALALLTARTALAADIDADPTSYQTALGALKPGDTLHLAAGHYPLLSVSNLAGTETAPITIAGAPGGASVIDGDPSSNTVEIVESSYVTIRGLTIDSKGLDGVFGLSAKGGTQNHVHHITVEGCTFVGQGASQQTDGISTKTPTWGWVIRGNVIDGAGTGLYLGNSDGTSPFVAGIIEGNLIKNTIGYNMQIKWQAPWPSGAGLPAGPNRTIVRDNVFIKDDQPSPDGDRPNLLIGGSPTSGPGSQDLYEIYGNFFFHNPREALLQVAGRVTVHDNVFVDGFLPAVVAQDHDLPLALARVYDNTIYTSGKGIHFGNAAPEGDFVVGNLIFAATAIDGPVTTQHDNITDVMGNAGTYVNSPSFTLGAMDFYPKPGKATGAPLDLSAAAMDTAYDRDFNGTSRDALTFRGAYAGEGVNPGWALGDGLKSTSASGTGGSGTGGAGTGGSNGAGGAGGGNGGTSGGKSGCGCDVAGDGRHGGSAVIAAVLAGLAIRRRGSANARRRGR